MFSLNLSLKESIGKWRVYVELISSEVRNGRMLFGAEFTLAPKMRSSNIKFLTFDVDSGLNMVQQFETMKTPKSEVEHSCRKKC